MRSVLALRILSNYLQTLLTEAQFSNKYWGPELAVENPQETVALHALLLGQGHNPLLTEANRREQNPPLPSRKALCARDRRESHRAGKQNGHQDLHRAGRFFAVASFEAGACDKATICLAAMSRLRNPG